MLPAALAVITALSELMGLTSTGPNGILDSIRHLIVCTVEWLKQPRADRALTPREGVAVLEEVK